MGYKPAEKLEDADIIIINTCCVRESAEKKIYGKIGEIKHLKQQKPDLILGITGCMAQKMVMPSSKSFSCRFCPWHK